MYNELPWNEKIKAEREKRRWSQEELAEALETDPRVMRYWEQGKHLPCFKQQRKLCSIFKMDPEQFGFVKGARRNTHPFEERGAAFSNEKLVNMTRSIGIPGNEKQEWSLSWLLPLVVLLVIAILRKLTHI